MFLQKRFEKTKNILFTLDHTAKRLTNKQEANQPIADLNYCPLTCRCQVLPLHHQACASNPEHTICNPSIYEKNERKKGSIEMT